MNQLGAEYWAGFFDGEGNIDIRYRRTHGGKYFRFELRLTITQVDQRPLIICQNQYGGSIVSPRNSVPRLVITGNAAKAFLAAVSPHLIVKAEEAAIAKQFIDLVEATPTNTKLGQYRFSRTDPAISAQKVVLFDAMREARAKKGIKPKWRVKRDFSWAT